MIQKVVEACFFEENLQNLNLYMSVTITTPENIKKLNNEYRNIDKETDVLSFPMFEKEEIDKLVKKQEKMLVPEVLGDAVVSEERVREQAVEYGHSFEREMSYMIVHSFYHLMGYDHMEENDKTAMRKKEENVLKKLGQTRE